MSGTILITAANSSLALSAVPYLLSTYADYKAILTVRDDSETDSNTKKLREVLSGFPQGRASIRQLDHTDLSAVHAFAHSLVAEIDAGKLAPLTAIVCNAYYWNLIDKASTTKDGFETSFQVSHLAHVALVLDLLRAFHTREAGRIVLLSSDAHWPGKNSLAKIDPGIPEDLDLLAKPVAVPEPPSDNFARGFQRGIQNITAVAINPGNLTDSRALRTNTPSTIYYLSKFIIGPLQPLLRFMDPTMRTTPHAAVDVIDLAVSKASPGVRGYFTLLKKDDSSPESNDEQKQDLIWTKSLEWVGIQSQDLP